MTSQDELRRRAEEIVQEKAAQRSEGWEAMSTEETQQMLHELQVHQIELEMQNEELRRTQAELETARLRYFDLYDLAPVGYLTVDAQGLIREANLTAAYLVGITRSELIKQLISQFVLKEDQDIYYLLRKQLIENGESQACDLRMVKNDGTSFWGHVVVTAVQDAEAEMVYRVVLSDVTQSKNAEQALQAASQYSRNLIETNLDPLLTISEEGKITDVNTATEKITGMLREKLIGSDFVDYFTEPDKAYAGYMKVFEDGQVTDYPLSIRHPSGMITDVLYNASVFRNDQGRVLGVFASARDVTERKRVEAALRESEERFRALFEQSHDGIEILNENDEFIDVNDAYSQMLGYTRDEILHMKVPDVTAPELRGEPGTVVRDELARGGKTFEAVDLHRDGHRIPIEVTTTALKGTNLAFAIVRDITERKRAEEALRESEEKLRAVILQSMDGILIADADFRITEWNDAQTGIFGYSKEEILGKSMWEFLYSLKSEEDKIPTLLQEYESSIREFGRSPHPDLKHPRVEVIVQNKDGRRKTVEASVIKVNIQDTVMWVAVCRDSTERKQAEEEIRSLARFPSENPNPTLRIAQDGILLYVNQGGLNQLPDWHLQAGERAPAMLRDVVSETLKIGSVRTLHLEHGERTFSFFIAPVVEAEYANLYGRDITESIQREEALRASEEKFKAVVAQSMDGILIADKDSSIIEWNDAQADIFGHAKEEMLGKPMWEYLFATLPIEDRTPAKLQSFGSLLLDTKHTIDEPIRSRLEYVVQAKDGQRRTIDASIFQISVQDVAYWGAISRDITERKQTEEALRESEEKFRSLFEQSIDGIAIVNQNDEFIDVNEAYCRMLGYSRDELLRMNVAEVQAPEARGEPGRVKRKELVLGKTFEGVDVHRDGYSIPIEITATSLKGTNQAVVIVRDISERKRAEEALRTALSRQEALLSAIPDIIMEVDRQKVYTWANQVGYAFFGADVVGKEASFYFEGEQATYSIVNPLFNGNEKVLYVESWQRRQDGEKRLLAWWCRVLKDSQGAVTGVLSTGRDITEQKQAEDENRSLARFVSENPDAVLRVAPDGVLLYVNQQGLSQLPEWHLQVGERVPSIVQDVVRECMGNTSRLSLDIEHGKQIFSFLVVPVDEAGYANLYGHDVTERRQSENMLAASEERFQLANRATFNAIWDWNLQTDALWWNENYQTLFGYPAEEIEPDIESWLNRIHPDDVDRVKAGIYAAIASGQDYWFDQYRLPRKDGIYADVEDRGYITRDASGRPVRMIGAMQDVSERKRLGVYAEMGREVLQILNEPADLQDVVQRVVATIKTRTGFDAVGIRLQDGDDFPYFAEKGFWKDFLLTENSLLECDSEGGVCRDEDGNVRLACTCGLVISGRAAPTNTFLTPGGEQLDERFLPASGPPAQ